MKKKKQLDGAIRVPVTRQRLLRLQVHLDALHRRDSCLFSRDGYLHDLFAVKVLKTDEIVGHLPKRISSTCSIFLRKGGTITCTINGERRYSRDLAQGGLEIPCLLTFEINDEMLISRVKKILDHCQSLPCSR